MVAVNGGEGTFGMMDFGIGDSRWPEKRLLEDFEDVCEVRMR